MRDGAPGSSARHGASGSSPGGAPDAAPGAAPGGALGAVPGSGSNVAPDAASSAASPRAASLPFPLAFALERGIGAVLAIDPDTRTRLARLDGRVVRVRVAEPTTGTAATPNPEGRRSLELALAIVDARVDVLRVFDGEADVTITGTLAALRSLASGNDALYTGAVKIEGDIGVAQGLRDIVGGLDIDLEEIVAPYLGGTLARRVGLAGRDLGAWFGRSRTRFRHDAKDYLEEEIRLVPTADEVNRWAEDVDELRGAADRLAARVARLERRRGTSGPGTKGSPDVPGAVGEPDDAPT